MSHLLRKQNKYGGVILLLQKVMAYGRGSRIVVYPSAGGGGGPVVCEIWGQDKIYILIGTLLA
jgi:hypothetical protein